MVSLKTLWAARRRRRRWRLPGSDVGGGGGLIKDKISEDVSGMFLPDWYIASGTLSRTIAFKDIGTETIFESSIIASRALDDEDESLSISFSATFSIDILFFCFFV